MDLSALGAEVREYSPEYCPLLHLPTQVTSDFDTLYRPPGSANIANADKGAAATRADKQVVPDAAVRPSDENKDYHTGRGGAGNAHLAAKADEVPIGLADKLKNKVLGIFRK